MTARTARIRRALVAAMTSLPLLALPFACNSQASDDEGQLGGGGSTPNTSGGSWNSGGKAGEGGYGDGGSGGLSDGGLGGQGGSATDPEPPPDTSKTPDTTFNLFGTGDCVIEPLPADICTWFESTDHIVLLEIEELRANSAAIIGRSDDEPGWGFVDSCELLSPALEVVGSVESTIKGNLSGPVSFLVGAGQIEWFHPVPILSVDEPPHWESVVDTDRGPLLERQIVLVALHDADEGRLSLMGEPILGVRDDGTVRAEISTGDCIGGFPLQLEGVHVDELADAFVECQPTDDSEVRRERLESVWGTPPYQAYAARCYVPPD